MNYICASLFFSASSYCQVIPLSHSTCPEAYAQSARAGKEKSKNSAVHTPSCGERLLLLNTSNARGCEKIEASDVLLILLPLIYSSTIRCRDTDECSTSYVVVVQSYLILHLASCSDDLSAVSMKFT